MKGKIGFFDGHFINEKGEKRPDSPSLPVDAVVTKEEIMFRITGNKGFHITLPNGVTISTQFGGGNYCENYDIPIERYKEGQQSINAEIAIWDKNNKWITGDVFAKIGDKDTGDVAGHITIEKWLKILDTAKAL